MAAVNPRADKIGFGFFVGAFCAVIGGLSLMPFFGILMLKQGLLAAELLLIIALLSVGAGFGKMAWQNSFQIVEALLAILLVAAFFYEPAFYFAFPLTMGYLVRFVLDSTH